MLTRFVRVQLVVFLIASLIGVSVMLFGYIQVQSFLGVGRTTITVELPASGALYRFSNVTYRGVQVGRVTNVDVVRSGSDRYVKATLSLDTSEKIPSAVTAHVRSVSAVGEQYVDLVPRSDGAPYLENGSVIARADTTIPQPVGPVLDKTSALVGSIPQGQLAQMLDELHAGFDGADYDLQSLFDSTAKLAGPLKESSDQTKTLLEGSQTLLDTQVTSDNAIRTWTRSLRGFTDQVVTNDPQIRSLLQKGPGSINEASRLISDFRMTMPLLLANLTSVGQLLATYRPALEQILVLLPPAISIVQAVNPNRNAQGLGLGSFRITVSDPPACTVGFLPPSSWRPTYDTTTIDTPEGLYCKLPQDSPIAVRGVRNIPCMTKPGKRAPTAEMCNSDEQFEPVAQKQPVIGPYPRDPGLEAQGIPPDSRWFPDQGLYSAPGEGPSAPNTPPPAPPTTMLVPPPAGGVDKPSPPPALPGTPEVADTPAAQPPPVDVPTTSGINNAPAGFAGSLPTTHGIQFANYNPRTGEYVGPDGKLYQQANLATASGKRTWQDLILSQPNS
ncbi:MCE family protein [Mycolicibacterium sp. HK-90]|uniref:MCE family protein n=1 Tax=Mycolicibacterium sp. HK-90 TaxID=3056937 RepID=UPI0026582B92|nr:MCE family protein [Mycolicibacterium sp. HK-90]WKG04061.1 MCE family protein [Mycolicibacterium sp. HK-90]